MGDRGLGTLLAGPLDNASSFAFWNILVFLRDNFKIWENDDHTLHTGLLSLLSAVDRCGHPSGVAERLDQRSRSNRNPA